MIRSNEIMGLWSCETLDALQVLTVATTINHGAAKHNLQVLAVATIINNGSANWKPVAPNINAGAAKN